MQYYLFIHLMTIKANLFIYLQIVRVIYALLFIYI